MKEVLLAAKAQLNAEVNKTSEELNNYVSDKRNEFGLVSESAKTPEYQQLKSNYNNAFQALRLFNAKYAKVLRKVA